MYFHILGHDIKRGIDFLIADLEEIIMLSEAHDQNERFDRMNDKHRGISKYWFDGIMRMWQDFEYANKKLETLRATRMFILDGNFYDIHYTQLEKFGLNKIKGVKGL